MNNKTGAASLRVQRKADEKRFARILKDTSFDVQTLQQLEVFYRQHVENHSKAQQLRYRTFFSVVGKVSLTTV